MKPEANLWQLVVNRITCSHDRFGMSHIIKTFLYLKFIPFTFIYTPFYIFIDLLYKSLYNMIYFCILYIPLNTFI